MLSISRILGVTRPNIFHALIHDPVLCSRVKMVLPVAAFVSFLLLDRGLSSSSDALESVGLSCE